MPTQSIDQILQETEELRRRLEEAEEMVRALREGEVDAVLVEGKRPRVFTLDSAETPYRLVVDQMPQAAASLMSQGTIIYANRGFTDLLQQPIPKIMGKPIHGFVAAESRAALETLLREARVGEARGEIVLEGPNGARKPVYFAARPLREGALGLCIVIADLTQQREYRELQHAQEALRASEERLARELADTRLLQTISAQLIWEDDVAALYQQIVEAASLLVRSDMASLQRLHPEGSNLELLAQKGFHPESATFWKWVRIDSGTACGAALRAGTRVIMTDVEGPGGVEDAADLESYRWSGIRGVQSTPLFSRDGQLLGMISTHWRKPHQPSERDLSLIDVLARQAADLIERKRNEQALRDADRRKDEFLATLAHELRNPLAPIRNAVEILKAKGPLEPDLLWSREVIERQVRLMARLLDDLLDVSRISRRTLELRKERVALASVIDAALEISRPVIEAGGHALTLTLPAAPIELDADPVRLAQVFANLLNNAAKYTESGGRIALTAERQGADVVVSVKDSGIGIAGDVLPHIFDIFAQAKPALPRAQGGLGVGLSLVKGLVELHGGAILARSEGPGKGSEFLVRLPLAAAATAGHPSHAQRSEVQEAPTPRRLLVADDDRDAANSLGMILRSWGHEVRVAYDGEQAIAAAAALLPDIALLDIDMPTLDGFAVCRHLRAQPGGQNLVLVALTGWGQDEDRRRTEEAGFDHHIVKPVELPALKELLASLASPRG